MQCPNGHGEFDPMRGCPQCIEEFHKAGAAEREAEDLAAFQTDIVKVRYIKQDTGEPAGREYSYLTEERLGVDYHVVAPIEHGTIEAVVTEIDVPEGEIAAFADRVRTIPAGSIMVRPAPELDFGPDPNAWRYGEEEQRPVAIELDHNASLFDTPRVREYVDAVNQEVEENMVDGPQDEGPSEGEYVEQLWDEQKASEAGAPPALLTIERQVGKPAPELFQLYQEAAGLLRVAKDRVITTNADLKPATDDLVVIATCKKAMFARKSELIGPLKEKLELVNQCFNELMSPITEADRITRGKVSEYDRIMKERAAQAARIEAEKLKLAQEEAAFTGTGEFDVPLNTVQAPPPVPEHTRTDLGTLGGRDNWKARVVDMKLLPDEFKIPDMQTLNAKAKSSKGKAVIPGVEFFNDRVVTVRQKGV